METTRGNQTSIVYAATVVTWHISCKYGCWYAHSSCQGKITDLAFRGTDVHWHKHQRFSKSRDIVKKALSSTWDEKKGYFSKERIPLGVTSVENSASLSWYELRSSDDMMLPCNPQDPVVRIQQQWSRILSSSVIIYHQIYSNPEGLEYSLPLLGSMFRFCLV